MPYVDRFQIEIMVGGTVLLHDNFTGQVVADFSGFTAYGDARAEKDRLDREATDEADKALWGWIREGETE